MLIPSQNHFRRRRLDRRINFLLILRLLHLFLLLFLTFRLFLLLSLLLTTTQIRDVCRLAQLDVSKECRRLDTLLHTECLDRLDVPPAIARREELVVQRQIIGTF